MKNIQFTIIFSSLLLLSCGKHPKESSSIGEPDVIAVRTASLSSYETPNVIQATGLISTENEVNYAFKIGGVISKIFVDEGQFFRKGQVLATLNATEISAGVAQSSLGVGKAQRDYDRALSLYKDSIFTLEQLQNTRTALDVAKKVKEAVAFNEHYANIYAASDGFVARKIAQEGEVVGGGMPILMTNSAGHSDGYILKVGVTDLEWTAIQIGQTAKIRLDGYPNQLFQAEVSRKLQSADREIGTFQVELKLKPGKDLLPVGMFGRAEIAVSNDHQAIAVPYSSLVEADGNEGFLYALIGKDRVRKVRVNILKFENDRVYLRDKPMGLGQIVISNSAFLNEQSIVKIIK